MVLNIETVRQTIKGQTERKKCVFNQDLKGHNNVKINFNAIHLR